jgi:hypothetical protein
MGRVWRVWKFVLLQRLPHTDKYVGFVIYVEPQNTTIFSQFTGKRRDKDLTKDTFSKGTIYRALT